MINAANFRRIRRRVMQHFAPEFTERSGTYIRQTEQLQLHCIQFASSKWGNEFTVDIGVHFAYMPSFEAFSSAPKVHHPEPESCCLRQRWRSSGNDQFFSYGESPEEANEVVETIVADCQRILTEINEKWQSGEKLLAELPPKTMKWDAEKFRQLLNCPDLQRREQISDSMTIRRLFPKWYPHVAPMCILLSFIAQRYGHSQLIPQYIAITKEPGQGHMMSDRVNVLIESL